MLHEIVGVALGPSVVVVVSREEGKTGEREGERGYVGRDRLSVR